MKVLGLLGYKYDFKVLSPKQFSVPQSRPRVYLAAVAEESVVVKAALDPPLPRDTCTDLHHFIDKDVFGSETLALPVYEEKLGKQVWEKGYILDVGASDTFQHPLRNLSPCLTRTRLGQQGYYVPKLRHRLLLSEAARLQSVPRKVLDKMLETGPERAVASAIGDAMSLCVLMTVLVRALDAAGLTTGLRLKRDYWKDVPLGEPAARMVDVLFDKVATA